MLKLGDLCTNSSSNIKQSDLEFLDGGYPIYGASGLIKNVNFYKMDRPYVGIVKDGAGVGRVMSLPAYSSVIGTMQYILPNEGISPDYLAYAMKHMKLAKYYTGATIPHIYFKDYKNEPIHEHTAEEMENIVRNLNQIESAFDICKRIMEKLDVSIKVQFIEMFGDPVHNEKKWSTKPLSEACRTIVDCPHSTPSYTHENTGYMCIRTSIVKKNHILWDEIEYIPEEEYYERIQRKRPQKGDVVYTREGAILGIAAIIDKECNVALGQRSMLLSPDTEQCTSEFLSVAMNCDSFLENALKGMSGSASPHINVGDIKAFAMIMPPIDLQNVFSAFVSQVNESKLILQSIIDTLTTLQASLMQKYFG